MSYRYAILDVFTDQPLAGNALAVLPDATGLDEGRMQKIAAGFNLSETVFCFPPVNPIHTAKVRIFTPRQELPFAGHPTVGTAVYLAAERLEQGTGLAECVVILEEGVGPVRCGVYLKPDGEGGARVGHAIFDAPRLPEPIAVKVDRDVLAAAIGLTPPEVGFENHVPTAFTAGLPYVFVPVRNLEVIGKVAPNPTLLTAAIGDNALYVYCRETVGVGRQFHARMFVPSLGIMEDPATGSAAAAFPGVIKHFDAHPNGTHRFVIEQGFEMDRPSLISLEVDVEGSAVAATRIGGDAVIVAEGILAV